MSNKREKVLIIAELSANHNGDLEVAKETIRAAKKAGADAIKLQTYTADTMTIDVKSDLFLINHGTAWDNQYLYDLYKQAYTPWEWHEELFKTAEEEGLLCFSSPFDISAVDFLEQFNPPYYKIASFEIHDIPLIRYVATKGRPVIMSTGIATKEDIELAVETCRKEGNNDITLLKCTSAYPAPIEDANLLTIPDLAKTFDVEVGFSDHTLGIEAPIVAVSLGAKVIEKHFILDKSIGGPDSHFSLDFDEFKALVQSVRKAEKLLGKVQYKLNDRAKQSGTFGRSLFIVEDVAKGEVFTEENIRSIRPGYGLHPKYYWEVLGKKATQNYEKGTPLTFECIEGGEVIKDI